MSDTFTIEIEVTSQYYETVQFTFSQETLNQLNCKNKDDLLEKIQNEDIDICERIQAGLESNGFDSGILSTEYEIGVSHFQNYI